MASFPTQEPLGAALAPYQRHLSTDEASDFVLAAGGRRRGSDPSGSSAPPLTPWSHEGQSCSVVFFLCSSCRDRGAVGTRSQHVVRCAIYVRKAHRQREYSTETACEQGSQWRRTESLRATKNEASRSHISRGNLDRLEVGGRCWNMRREAPPSHPSKTPAAATPRHLR